MDKLQVHLLGAFEARLGERSLHFNSDKMRALLAYLLIESRAHRRESLADLLWGEMPPDKAATNLRLSLSRLRGSLEPFLSILPDEDFLVVSRTTVAITPRPEAEVDAISFDALLDLVDAHPHDDPRRCSVCAHRLTEALELYSGDFLSGLNLPDALVFDEWRVQQQERLHRRAMDALDVLIAHKMAVASWDEAERLAEQQLRLEPWREETYRRLMEIRLALGDRNGALALFERCREVLDSELGTQPSAETRTLAERIRTLGTKAALDPASAMGAAPIRHNLPSQRLPFFGREAELRELCALLIDPAYRLVTLMGMGGAGKTRMAQTAARRVLSSFPDGVWFVPLAAITAEGRAAVSEILQAIAAAVGYQFTGRRSEQEQVLGYLAGKRMLLVLDNFEQLLGVSELVLDILDGAQELSLLVTSRERLLFQEEFAWLVDSLALPPAGTDDVQGYSSVQLFVSRAAQHPGGFRLNAGNAAAVAAICRLVDGIPLAIELAASWAFAMSAEQIGTSIGANIDFLQTSMRNLPSRHRSMRAVFEGSWDLLPPAEQGALARLSIFRGSFTLDAASIVAGLGERDLLLLALKSFVVRRDSGRYEMHELLREYAVEKLGEDRKLAEEQSRFYLLALADSGPAMEGTEARKTLSMLQLDSGNLRAAWGWAVLQEEWRVILSGVESFSRYLWVQGLFHEGLRTFDEARQRAEAALAAGDIEARPALAALLIEEALFLTALGRNDEGLASATRGFELLQHNAGPALRVRGLQHLAAVYRRMGRFPEAVEHYRAAVDLAEGANLHLVVASSLSDLGRVYAEQGYFEQASGYLTRSLELYRGLNNLRGQSIALNGLGMVTRRQGDYSGAHAYYSQTLQVAQQIDYREGIKIACANLGLVFEGLGQYNRALEFFRRSLEISRQLGDRWGETVTFGNMGTVYLHYGDYDQAQAQFVGSLAMAREINDLQGQTWALQHLSWVSNLRAAYEAAQDYGQDSLLIARQINDRDNVGFALLHLGYAALGRGDSVAAITHFSASATLRRELGQSGLLLEALAGLAAAHLAADDVAAAYVEVQEILGAIATVSLASTMEHHRIYLACYETLVAAGEPARAREVIAQTWRILSEEAGNIDRDDIRRSFLLNVPLHARITQLAAPAARSS